MTTPITEHPEFRAEFSKEMAIPFPSNIAQGQFIQGYERGAKTCQSILQKEHEEEILDWEHWQLENVKSIHRISGIEYILTKGRGKVSFKEAFQLFRERDGK